MNEKTLKILEYDKIIKKLAGFAASQLGKEKAEALLPAKDIDTVTNMLKETDDGVKYIVTRGMPTLGGIRDIRNLLKRVEMGAILNPGELLNAADVLRLSRNLKSHAFVNSKDKDKEKENIVLQLIGRLEPNKRIEDKIEASIASEEEIRDDASIALRSIRKQIREQQDSTKEKLNSMIRSPKYSKYIQEPIVTIREGRYVIPVKQEYKNEISGLIHDSSSSGVTIFIEPMAAVEANNYIKQLIIKEQAEIEKILSELTADIAGILNQLKSNIEILTKLDFIFAKASLGLHYNCILPKLNTEGRIIINKGRHPLIEHERVVPIDFRIGEEFSTVIITGPNTGGKTVTLKTIGLFTIMVQAGLHIPVSANSEISVFNEVFADIGDEQSIEQSLSTFSSHMSNIVNILKRAGRKSLVLLDEIGAGTDPTEGAALAMAILEYLHQKGSTVIATTHYSELKLYAMASGYAENASCEFDVETLRPTYRLLIGIPGKSNAFEISKRLGLLGSVLEKAKDFLSRENIRFEDILATIEKEKKEIEKEKIKAEAYRLEAEKLKNELMKQKEKIYDEKGKIVKEAKEEARRILEEAMKESEAIIAELKRLKREREIAEKNKKIEKLKYSLKNRINKLDEDLKEPLFSRENFTQPPENLKPGDSVLIINLNQKGILEEMPDSNGEAVVRTGVIKINVHVSNLKIIDEQKIQNKKIGIGQIGKTKAMNISTELDLRGLSLDDAIEKTDKYLDDATIVGLKSVVLIHGKGTGILRAGIHTYLRNNSHVKSFRLGKFGEGEAGVTVVELK
jgi:DNA mismatch repair protein MutS2